MIVRPLYRAWCYGPRWSAGELAALNVIATAMAPESGSEHFCVSMSHAELARRIGCTRTTAVRYVQKLADSHVPIVAVVSPWACGGQTRGYHHRSYRFEMVRDVVTFRVKRDEARAQTARAKEQAAHEARLVDQQANLRGQIDDAELRRREDARQKAPRGRVLKSTTLPPLLRNADGTTATATPPTSHHAPSSDVASRVEAFCQRYRQEFRRIRGARYVTSRQWKERDRAAAAELCAAYTDEQLLHMVVAFLKIPEECEPSLKGKPRTISMLVSMATTITERLAAVEADEQPIQTTPAA